MYAIIFKILLFSFKHRTNYGKFKINFYGPKVWNEVDESMKTLSFRCFKWELKVKLLFCYSSFSLTITEFKHISVIFSLQFLSYCVVNIWLLSQFFFILSFIHFFYIVCVGVVWCVCWQNNKNKYATLKFQYNGHPTGLSSSQSYFGCRSTI